MRYFNALKSGFAHRWQLVFKSPRSKKIFLVSVSFLAVSLVCFYIYKTELGWFTLDDKKIYEFNEQATTDASRFLFKKAIEELKELNFIYTVKGDINLAARMMIKIGFQYNKDGDYLTGIPILKKVAFNEKLSPEIRSEAIARLIMAYSGNEKKEIMQAIFNDNNNMIKDALGRGNMENLEDLRRAAVSLLEKAKNIYEYGYLDYLLAARKSYLLMGEIRSLSNGGIEMKKEEILFLIKRGDELTEKEINMSDFKRGGFNYDFLLSGQSQKLQAFAELAYIDRVYEKSATDVFSNLKTIRDKYYKNGYNAPSYLGTESFIRFYYASMLAHFHGAAYKKEIEGIIAPTMVETGNWGITNRKIIWRFYENELTKTERERGSNYKSITEIASISPDFNKFIIRKEWSND
ncbi:hypothetical protein D4R52_03345 [bacterium]|nr:MAG: hypothetical protein D4R52_03345 [bacterium]